MARYWYELFLKAHWLRDWCDAKMRATQMKTSFLAFACLGVSALYASTTYTFKTSAGAKDGSGNSLDATVVFEFSNTALYVAITNDEADPTAASQLISDLGFSLSGDATGGTLSTSISSEIGTSAGVGLLEWNGSSFVSGGTTTTIPNNTKNTQGWTLTDNDTSATDCGSGVASCYFLNALTGGQPKNMIIGPGPYTNANSSIQNFSDDSLTGQVVFEIEGISGLTANTTIQSAYLSFGTNPDAFATLDAVAPDSVTPEPWSFALVGTGLLAVGLIRRKTKPADPRQGTH
jgi:hypothetical protein